MCQAVNSSKPTRWNTRVSRLLILAGLSLWTVVQNSQSMPPREFRRPAPSSARDRSIEEYEEFEYPEYPRNRSLRIEETRRDRLDSIQEKPSLDRDAIEYPGAWERRQPIFSAQPLPDCMGQTFCEGTASAYPQEYLSNLIKKSDGLKLFSASDKITIGPRVDSSDGAILCSSEERVVYPTAAKNREDKWLFILQDTKQGYQQGVKIENCNTGTSGGSCNIIEGSIFGYTTSCKQKYVFRILAAVHENGTAVTEDFSMPSSCCCQIKRTDGIISRIGGAAAPKQTPARLQAKISPRIY